MIILKQKKRWCNIEKAIENYIDMYNCFVISKTFNCFNDVIICFYCSCSSFFGCVGIVFLNKIFTEKRLVKSASFFLFRKGCYC